MCVCVFVCILLFFCCVWFSFSVLSQDIGREERLRNGLFYAVWDVKSWLNQSVTMCVCVCVHVRLAASFILAAVKLTGCRVLCHSVTGSGTVSGLLMNTSSASVSSLSTGLLDTVATSWYWLMIMLETVKTRPATTCVKEWRSILRQRWVTTQQCCYAGGQCLYWNASTVTSRAYCISCVVIYLVSFVLFSLFLTHTPVQRPFSGTTQVSRYQKGRSNLDFTEARNSEWQWHQLGHMQACTSLQTDNHASTPPLVVSYFAEIFRPHHMHRMRRSDLFIHM